MISLSKYTFDYALRGLIVLLPFLTVLTVFTKERLGIPGFSFVKELMLISMIGTLALLHMTNAKKIIWTRYDLAIGSYILVMIGVSCFTTGMPGIVYGGKYDFSFFLLFLAVYHGYSLLEKPLSYYLKLFLMSAGVMLVISMLLKWPLSEDLLLYLGYSGNPSNWQFGSSIPIFHGVDGANVRRFQGLLDGPNTMGAFLILYIGIFVYYLRTKKDWHFVIGCIVLVFVALVLYTYSRSAALGLIGGVGIIILFSLKYIYQKYRLQFFSILGIATLVLAGLFIQYAGNMKAIIERGGSTNGHKERMMVGLERFISHPLGQGLASAGPAYRYIQNLENKDRAYVEEKDRFYIPESWYIQQMIEGGVLGIFAFLTILGLMLYRLSRIHIVLVGMFTGVLIMNLFLHTFESSVVSLSLFLILGLLIARAEHAHEGR